MSEKEAKGQVTFIAVVAVIIKVLLVLLIVATAIFEYWMYREITTPQITDSTFYSSKVYYDSEAFDIEQLSLTFKKLLFKNLNKANAQTLFGAKIHTTTLKLLFTPRRNRGKN